MRIRWVTWWPVRYWTERFNALEERSDCELDVLFLAGRSAILDCAVDESQWRFRYKYRTRSSDTTGYHGSKRRVGNSLSLLFPRVDALIMSYADPICIGAALLSRVIGRPYYLFAANTRMDHRRHNRYKEWLKRIMFRGAKGILVTGPRQRDYVLQYVNGTSNISVIGNPAPPVAERLENVLLQREALRHEHGWDATVVALFVGRLSGEKGLLTLMGAVGRLAAKGIGMKVVMVGSGPLREDLRQRGSELGVDLELPGFVEGPELASIYAAADIFVLPSLSEPWGLVVNEAMEFGLPLLLSRNVGAAPVLLREGVNGYSFEPDNEDELALVLERLQRDPLERREMGCQSRTLIESHTISAWTDAVMTALQVGC